MVILLLISIASSIILTMKRSIHLSLSLNLQLKSLFSPPFWEKLSSFLRPLFQRLKLPQVFHQVPRKIMSLDKNMEFSSEETKFSEEKEVVSLLDLPELTLECILERLSPSGLSSMSGVCNYLRERCTSDHVWEKHMKQKWGRVIGDAAYRKWQCQIDLRNGERMNKGMGKKNGVLESICNLLSFSWIRPILESSNIEEKRNPISLPIDSIMTRYLSLEKGEFRFPAQVYNRENGSAGFMLSCYDAELSYDSQTDTFQARYPSSCGRGTAEGNISWDRIRTPPVGTPHFELHISDCLNDLKPGDHIEIQWRKSKEFPYGWWYGVVGHLEACSRSGNHCQCCHSDTVKLEFNQYPLDSRWRQTEINRKNHREEGSEVGGFYGGLRKLCRNEEIAMWKSLWPTQILE